MGQNKNVFNCSLKVELEVWSGCAILACEATATCWTDCRGRRFKRRKQGATASLLDATKEFSIGSVLAASLIRNSCKKLSTR